MLSAPAVEIGWPARRRWLIVGQRRNWNNPRGGFGCNGLRRDRRAQTTGTSLGIGAASARLRARPVEFGPAGGAAVAPSHGLFLGHAPAGDSSIGPRFDHGSGEALARQQPWSFPREDCNRTRGQVQAGLAGPSSRSPASHGRLTPGFFPLSARADPRPESHRLRAGENLGAGLMGKVSESLTRLRANLPSLPTGSRGLVRHA